MARPSRLIGKISSFVAAGGFFAAAIIVGLIPYSEGGYSGVCPSALQGMFGGMNTGQSIINLFSGGRCTAYVSTMTTIMFVLLALAVFALVAAILLRRRASAAGGHGYPYAPAGHQDPGSPAQPGYAPTVGEAATDQATGMWQTAGAASEAWPAPSLAHDKGSGTFDTKLLLVGLAAVAGAVVVSFIVDWLNFLPGIVELALWTAVGLTVIWQLKRRAAGGDPAKLAEAERWNPAAVTRNLIAAGRYRLEIHRAQRREAERNAQAYAAAEQSYHQPYSGEPQYTDHTEPEPR